MTSVQIAALLLALAAEDDHIVAAETSSVDGYEKPIGVLSVAQMRWIQNRWSGFGIGYDNGLWDGSFGQTLKLSIPFGRRLGRFLGARVRGGVVHYTSFAEGGDRYDPVINVGGELFGRTPVWWGVLRVYGGGGLFAAIRPSQPSSSADDVGLGVGGHFGVEAFAAPFMSFTLEIGGQTSGFGGTVYQGGGSAMGGVMFYFGRNAHRWRP